LIRPFRLSDIFLVQRLAGQATKLNAAQALLFPHSALYNALSAIIPWGDAKVTTYILHQKGHQLARVGFLQVQKRPNRPEADLLLLAPALDTQFGHPAIWEKLLSHYSTEASVADIDRVYADVPDQPLLVNTLRHVGFVPYCRETIWRLNRDHFYQSISTRQAIMRPKRTNDDWALSRLYGQVTPELVQRAEGIHAGDTENPPILRCDGAAACHTFVLEEDAELIGCIQLRAGRRGVWLRLWADTLNPDPQPIRLMLHHALAVVRESAMRMPVYIGVSDYHGGLEALLHEYGFAPFSDRAKLVRHVVQRVRERAPAFVSGLETVTEAVPSAFTLPEQQPIRIQQRRQSYKPVSSRQTNDEVNGNVAGPAHL
jgi:hypothetical protein